MFTTGAARLAGVATLLLGWRPDDFWHATPAELATILAAMAPPADTVGDNALITRLQEAFPDG
jgi:Phage tail assembly chaperone protein, TAC